MSKSEIDVVTAEFFDAFDNRGGKAADVARIRQLIIPGGVIVKTGPEFTVYTVDEFIEPRQRLLTDGRLVEFSEWETSERTEIAGDIASRFGEYRKSGILDGEPFEGDGTKTIQFACVLTRDETRIATGALTIACASQQPNQPLKGIPIPPDIAARFQVAAGLET